MRDPLPQFIPEELKIQNQKKVKTKLEAKLLDTKAASKKRRLFNF